MVLGMGAFTNMGWNDLLWYCLHHCHYFIEEGYIMSKKKKRTEFSECKSRLSKLEHQLKVNEERRMIYRRMKQGEQNENKNV